MFMKTRFQRQQGFTLIELLVTMAIIAVLAGIAVKAIPNYIRRSRIAEGEAALRTTRNALSLAAFDCSTYNLTQADLETGNAACAGPMASTGWLERPWDFLAPNYTLAITPNPGGTGGALLEATGNNPTYATYTPAAYPERLSQRVGY